MVWIHWSQYSYIVNFQHGASASVQWVKNEIHNLRMGISWWAKRLETPPILMISQYMYIHVYGKCISTACLLLLLYTIVWQIHSLSLFYKSEGIDEVDKQRLRLVKRVMGGTGGKNPPSSKEKPVKETFIPPELSMVTFFMTKVRERCSTKHILNSQFCFIFWLQ